MVAKVLPAPVDRGRKARCPIPNRPKLSERSRTRCCPSTATKVSRPFSSLGHSTNGERPTSFRIAVSLPPRTDIPARTASDHPSVDPPQPAAAASRGRRKGGAKEAIQRVVPERLGVERSAVVVLRRRPEPEAAARPTRARGPSRRNEMPPAARPDCWLARAGSSKTPVQHCVCPSTAPPSSQPDSSGSR